MRLFSLITVLLLAIACRVDADSSAPASDIAFRSADGNFIFLVQPVLSDDPQSLELQYLKQEHGMTVFPKRDKGVCTLLKLHKKGNVYTTVWNAALDGDAGPVRGPVMISQNGARVVVLSDYPEESTVVIYDNHGKVIANYPLAALLTPVEMEAAPQSVSSVEWQGKHSIDRKRNVLLLRVWRKGRDHNMASPKPEFRTVIIDLQTGKIIDDGRKS